jgi:hypothetical protein
MRSLGQPSSDDDDDKKAKVKDREKKILAVTSHEIELLKNFWNEHGHLLVDSMKVLTKSGVYKKNETALLKDVVSYFCKSYKLSSDDEFETEEEELLYMFWRRNEDLLTAAMYVYSDYIFEDDENNIVSSQKLRESLRKSSELFSLQAKITQDHSVSEDAQKLVWRLFNDLLDPAVKNTITDNKKKIDNENVNKGLFNDVDFYRVERTGGGRCQALNLFFSGKKADGSLVDFHIYMAANKHGPEIEGIERGFIFPGVAFITPVDEKSITILKEKEHKTNIDSSLDEEENYEALRVKLFKNINNAISSFLKT